MLNWDVVNLRRRWDKKLVVSNNNEYVLRRE
jgi:hypothetical protein